ncbi:MAG: flagellar hook-associated protein FlgL [Lachnospiraceae bacterium]|nr:flagellar hook-associated protein FlgL [Lachnospiraceae bacterium]
MRITNKMMTNNALYNINNNKNLMSNLEQQYSSGKKITKPSDDPIVAVRALKFRTNLSELNQYYEKNIPDALAWMDVTESALSTVNDIITSMNTYCNQGANDYPTAEDRNAIATTLMELKGQLYQEGNTNYAGRYVFSGYKTDTSLVFNEASTNLKYEITEPLEAESIDRISRVLNESDFTEFDPNNLTTWNTDMPYKIEQYRMKLSYTGLEKDAFGTDEGLKFSYTTEAGVEVELDGTEPATARPKLNQISVLDEKAYDPEEGTINFIPETGELILSKDMYEELRTSTNIKAEYVKDEFDINDLRPEHYFDCTVTDTEDPAKEPVTYTKQDQQIQYEVNFNQKLTINTQGSDAFTTGITRMIDEIVNSINSVKAVEDAMLEVDKMLADTSVVGAKRTKLEEIKEQLKAEHALKTTVMTEAFQRGITITEQEQEVLNVATADMGGRYKRLQLTQSRLSDQQVDFEELLSNNEDADLVDTIIKYSAAETVYNSSLSAASKLVQTSLMDFL